MRSTPILALALTSLLFTGCVIAGADEPTAEVPQAQIPAFREWRSVELVFGDALGTPLATMFVVTRTLGSYEPGTEYWYVNRDALGMLGAFPIEITTRDFDAGSPRDPGYSLEQAFTQVEYPTGGWGASWTTDPLSGGTLYGGGGGIQVRISTSTRGEVSRVAWYQVIPSTAAPQWITPGGRFTVSGASATVAAGYVGYVIDQAAL